MKNPFKISDVVYHILHGESQVVEVEDDTGCVRVQSKDGHRYWLDSVTLSFKPWPAPCHVRPIEEGWWIVNYSHNDDPLIRLVKEGRVHCVGATFPLSKYTLHKYLGKDWK